MSNFERTTRCFFTLFVVSVWMLNYSSLLCEATDKDYEELDIFENDGETRKEFNDVDYEYTDESDIAVRVDKDARVNDILSRRNIPVRFEVSIIDERFRDQEDYIETCNGVIISMYHIMTDASCFHHGTSLDNYFAYSIGELAYSEDANEKRHYIDNVYERTNITSELYVIDYCLAKVKEPFVWSFYVQPLVVPNTRNLSVYNLKKSGAMRIGRAHVTSSRTYYYDDVLKMSFYSMRPESGNFLLLFFESRYVNFTMGFLQTTDLYDDSMTQRDPIFEWGKLLDSVNHTKSLYWKAVNDTWVYKVIGDCEGYDVREYIAREESRNFCSR